MMALKKLTLDQLLLMIPICDELEVKKESILSEIKKRLTDIEKKEQINKKYLDLCNLGKQLLIDIKEFSYSLDIRNFYDKVIDYEVKESLKNAYFTVALRQLEEKNIIGDNENKKIFIAFVHSQINLIIEKNY